MAEQSNEPIPQRTASTDAPTKAEIEKVKRAAKKTPEELRLDAQEEARRQREMLNRVTPMVVIDENDASDAIQTDRLLEEAARLNLEELKRQAEKAEAEYIYFVKCRARHGNDPQGRPLPSHGIYLKSNSGAAIVQQTEWRARYKRTYEEPCFGEIICQVCLREFGEERKLDVTMHKNRTFTVDPRWLWRRPKNEKRLLVEGETRANDVQYESSNFGRREAMERARVAGLEVIP